MRTRIDLFMAVFLVCVFVQVRVSVSARRGFLWSAYHDRPRLTRKLSRNLPGHRIAACLGKAALKTHALQTLRDCRASPNRAKRLECVRFIGAFRPARDGRRFVVCSRMVAADVRRRILARKTLPLRDLSGYDSCDDS